MPNRQTVLTSCAAVLISFFMMSIGCSDNTLQDKLKKYYSSISAAERDLSSIPHGASARVHSDSGPAAIVGGTPREVSGGFCGDGIINGSTEDCDGGAIQNTACEDYNALGGVVTCQPNCLYDISKCITPQVNVDLGGVAETCKCSCDTQRCAGACSAVGGIGQSACTFDCKNNCVCHCDTKLQAHVESCDFECACSVNASGTPECNCTLSECDLVATIVPHIADIISKK